MQMSQVDDNISKAWVLPWNSGLVPHTLHCERRRLKLRKSDLCKSFKLAPEADVQDWSNKYAKCSITSGKLSCPEVSLVAPPCMS